MHAVKLSAGAMRCRRKFLRIFPGGFHDPDYVDLERSYKWKAHRGWCDLLDETQYRALLREHAYAEVAATAIAIESRTNLLFSFEKMALRDAVKPEEGARSFAVGLFAYLYGDGSLEERFERWRDVVAELPRKQTRVLTWPVLTVFGFIAQPRVHMYLKPTVTRTAAHKYGFDFRYHSRPAWDTYASLLEFAALVRHDLRDLRPRDMIDIQSFIWINGSDEYA